MGETVRIRSRKNEHGERPCREATERGKKEGGEGKGTGRQRVDVIGPVLPSESHLWMLSANAGSSLERGVVREEGIHEEKRTGPIKSLFGMENGGRFGEPKFEGRP